MRRLKLCGLFLLLVSLCFPIFIFAETIVLRSGKTIEGKIIGRTDEDIKVEVINAVSTTYYFEDVISIDGNQNMEGRVTTLEVETKKKHREIAARQKIVGIEEGIKVFKGLNGRFPSDISELLMPKAKPPFISIDDYAPVGYSYTIDFNPNGYKIVATPKDCGKTGDKVFILENGKEIIGQYCK